MKKEEFIEDAFAYLKELFLASMILWIEVPQAGIMDKLMSTQAEILRQQIQSISTSTNTI